MKTIHGWMKFLSLRWKKVAYEHAYILCHDHADAKVKYRMTCQNLVFIHSDIRLLTKHGNSVSI